MPPGFLRAKQAITQPTPRPVPHPFSQAQYISAPRQYPPSAISTLPIPSSYQQHQHYHQVPTPIAPQPSQVDRNLHTSQPAQHPVYTDPHSTPPAQRDNAARGVHTDTMVSSDVASRILQQRHLLDNVREPAI